jgi:flagellar motor switch protein FliN
MDETNNEEAAQNEQPNLQAVEGLHDVQVEQLADQIKAGDDSLNKLKVQNLDFILDIPLKVTVELGRTEVIIKDLLQLGQGSVLELDKLAGEPLEILVNGKLVAKGEVVVVNEKFGIRLTDIISPIERIETLK